MNTLLNRLFSTSSLAFGGDDVELRFARPLALWVWVGIIAACFAISLWSYWRLVGSRTQRISLGLLRGLSLVLLALLISGPELIKQNERIEQDWVVVLADRSASMNVSDAPSGSGQVVTRNEQLGSLWEANSSTFAAIAKDRNLLVLGFDASTYDLPVTDGKIEFGPPQGSRTRIEQVLDQALRRTAARPVAGIVLMTDGRSSDETSRGLLRQLEAKRIPVFAVALGSETSPPDLALTRTEAPNAAFIGDLIPVQVDVDLLGLGDSSESQGTVTLIDEATGQVLDERPLPALAPVTPLADTRDPTSNSPPTPPTPSQTRRVTLLAKPLGAGQATWTVRLNPAGPDLTKENNQTTLRIDVADRPIRVLYFDGYPRWEYRYIKNILVREPSIRSSVLILGGERRYIQDGTHILDALPRSARDWQDFDVIIIGDMRPQLFSAEQLEQMRESVSQRGTGLLWIGGSGSTPAAWRATPLADLLPFTLTAATDSQGLDAYLDPVFITPGDAAQRYGVLQLSPDPLNPWPGELLDSKLGWPLMRWAQRIPSSQLKPTTEVLAYAMPASGANQAQTPLVMSMRYGAGRVIYTGTDETWRYRYSRGEVLTERFWIPLIRLLARESLGRGGRPATIAASPRQVQVGQQAQISLRLLDQTLIDQRPAQANVRLTREVAGGGGLATRPIEITLTPQRESGDSALDSVVSVFSSTWAALEPGVYSIEPSDPLLTGLGLSTRLEVFAPDDELRFPQTNHAALVSLASETGGQVLKPEEIKDLPTLLPNREVRILSTPDVETLWDKPVVWAVLLFLFAVEWLGRRLMKLA